MDVSEILDDIDDIGPDEFGNATEIGLDDFEAFDGLDELLQAELDGIEDPGEIAQQELGAIADPEEVVRDKPVEFDDPAEIVDGGPAGVNGPDGTEQGESGDVERITERAQEELAAIDDTVLEE